MKEQKTHRQAFLLSIITAVIIFAAANSVAAFPKPDFSEMEKWYEIVKYEYGDMATDNKLYFWVKPKTEAKPEFRVQFLDQDGTLICSIICDNGGFYITGNFDTVPVGTVGKATVITPSEREMEKVASVRVIRIKK